MAVKTVFTTGEAARICQISQQTIIRCFNLGQLGGFRVPNSKYRRIPREALLDFMLKNDIPTDALDSGKRKVLVADSDPKLADSLAHILDEDGRFECQTAKNGFEAGAIIKSFRPEMVILDVMLPGFNGKESVRWIRKDSTMAAVKIICTGKRVKKEKISALKRAGANDVLQKPIDADTLVARILFLLDGGIAKKK